MNTKITRSAGMPTGLGYLVGNGYEGKTKELDDKVYEIAEQLKAIFGKDIEIRYNSDRESGGAFVKDDEYSFKIGIGASLVSSEFRAMSREEKLNFPMKNYHKLPKDMITYHIVLDKSIAKPGIVYPHDFKTAAKAFEFLKNSIDPLPLEKYLKKLPGNIIEGIETIIKKLTDLEISETSRNIKTDCLYCLEEFTFNTDDIDDMGWISCPKCGGKHETKGFI